MIKVIIKEGKYDKLDLPDQLDIDEISSKNDEAEQKLAGAAKPLPEINGGKADKLETTLQTEIIILESSRSEETAESEATKFWIKELQLTQEDKRKHCKQQKKNSSRHINVINILLKKKRIRR